MKTPIRMFIILITFFAICNLQFAIDANAAFTDNLYSARINSMGGAFVAVADDSQDVFVQPAGLVNLLYPELSVSYGHVYFGLSDGSQITSPVLSFGMPLSKKFAFGLGYKSMGLENIYNESLVTTALSYKLNGFSSLGIALKNMNVQYGSDAYTAIDPLLKNKNSVSGYDMDIGLFLQPLPYLSLGYSKQDLLGANLGLDEKVKSPDIERIGIAYKENMFKVTFENIRQDSLSENLFGIEKLFMNNMFALRFGFGWGDNEFGRLSAGAGLNFNQFSLDYSFDYPIKGIENMSGIHYLTFNVRLFNPKENALHIPAKAEQPDSKEQKQAIKKKLQDMILAKPPHAPAKEEKKVESIRKEPQASLNNMTSRRIYFPVPGTCQPISEIAAFKVPELYGSSICIFNPFKSFPFEPDEAKKNAAISPAETPQQNNMNSTLETTPIQEQKAAPAPSVPKAPKAKKLKNVTKVQSKEQDKCTAFRSHKVESGETLPMIAKKYYGKESDWIKIYEANKDNIEKGSLKQGQILVIPQ